MRERRDTKQKLELSVRTGKRCEIDRKKGDSLPSLQYSCRSKTNDNLKRLKNKTKQSHHYSVMLG